MKALIKPNAKHSAIIFGCTVAQAKALFDNNAFSLRAMADQAASSGKKVNGYTEADLRASAAQYAEAAQ